MDDHDMTPSDLQCPQTIEKTKTLKTKASAVTENDESDNTPAMLPSTSFIPTDLLNKQIANTHEEVTQAEKEQSKLTNKNETLLSGQTTPLKVASHAKYNLIESKLIDRDSM